LLWDDETRIRARTDAATARLVEGAAGRTGLDYRHGAAGSGRAAGTKSA
jgi:hypothetical protein